MIKRYENQGIAPIWVNENKLKLWQETELAVNKARVKLGMLEAAIYDEMEAILLNTPFDIQYWLERDREIHHDLNAFLDERLLYLPKHLHDHWHEDMTSFDTQEAAFATMIMQSLVVISELCCEVEGALIKLARRHRYTLMNARTHGNEAKLQSFGKRCLHWLQLLRLALKAVTDAKEGLTYSKLAGAIGNFGGITPELEECALEIIGFKPFRGTTQIMPRQIYLPTAQGLCQLVQVMNQIATDIRLSARSGRPLMHEPFKKKQKGSSAMPHKKNPIRCEQMEGMERMARNYLHMIEENVRTWEERAIEQSSVERVAWPDLFHVTAQALSEMAYVLSDLRVYPDNMLLEIIDSRGTYASEDAKEFLKERMTQCGFIYEDAYRVVQLASFNVFELPEQWQEVRDAVPNDFSDSVALLKQASLLERPGEMSIQELISFGALRTSDQLDISDEQIYRYNWCLKEIFSGDSIRDEWDQVFSPAHLLRHEPALYRDILGE